MQIAVPELLSDLLDLLRDEIGLRPELDRLYYFSRLRMENQHRQRLRDEEGFAQYAAIVKRHGRLPDLWVLRSLSTDAPSPDQLPVADMNAAERIAKSSTSRSSAQQSEFRVALLRRDAAGKDSSCALCDRVGDVQAAHILPQDSSLGDMTFAPMTFATPMTYRNGLLLCDKCHDFSTTSCGRSMLT